MSRERVRAELLALTELIAVSALAIAQPAFDLLSRNVFVLSLRGVDRLDLVVIAAAILLAPPIAWWLVELLVHAVFGRARRAVHAAGLGLAAGMFVLGVLVNNTSLVGALTVAGAVIATIAFGLAAWRLPVVRTWLRFAAVAAPVFGLLFVGFSAAGDATTDAAQSAGVDIPDEHRVVFIVLDELPLASIVAADGSGTIDADLVPNIARLAGDATWYRNNATVAPLTDAALPALLTGTIPDSATTPAINARYPDSLFTLLSPRYAIHAHESVTQVCPVRLCHADLRQSLSAVQRIRAVLDDAASLLRDHLSPSRPTDVVDLAGAFSLDPDPLSTGVRFVENMRGGRRPRLDLIHVFLPHLPWQYLEDGRRASAPAVEPGSVTNRWASEWAAAAGRQRHLQQVQVADRLVGMVLDKLEQLDEYDDSLIVLTADHGAAFMAGEPLRGLSEANAAQIVWTPLIVKYPGQTDAHVDDRLARTTDIVPTIADVLGVTIPWEVDGHSLLGEPAAAEPTAVEIIDWSLSPLRPVDDSNSVQVEAIDNFAAALAGITDPFAPEAGGAADPARRYRLGEYGALVGTPIDGWERVDPGATATLGGADRFAAVDPDALVLTHLDVAGTVDRNIADGTLLAIGVNGTIVGLSEVGAGGTAGSWFARLWPEPFLAGANTIELFALGGPPAAPVLTPLPFS